MYKIILFCILFNYTLYANNSYNNIFKYYGKKYNIPAELLWGIASHESKFNPNAIGKNPNGTTDYGLMQINSIHKATLEKRNLTIDDLFNPKINIAMGAEILSKCFDKHGFTWQGLNCYNGRVKNNPYHKNVLNEIKKRRLNNAKYAKTKIRK